MAFYSVALTDCNCPNRQLCNSLEVIIEDNSNQLIVGNVYSFSGISQSCPNPPFCLIGLPFGCYVVGDIRISVTSTPTAIIVNSYGNQNPSGCEDCLSAIANYARFIGCFNTEQNTFIPINQLTPPLPNLGDIFFLEYYTSGEGGNFFGRGCYQFGGLQYIDSNQIFIPAIILTTISAQTDCQTCLDTSPLVYDVVDCASKAIVSLALPSDLTGHLITYTDLAGLTQFCGVVQGLSESTTTAIFVTDLGVYDEENGIDCNYCLSFDNEKRLLVNCLDNNEQQVVWASNLFDIGNSTHLSIGNGCYQVSGVVDPMSAVTINELANYDPQKDCEDCLECYGVIYDFITCEPLEVCEPQNFINTNTAGFGGADFVITNTDRAFVPLFFTNRIIEVDLLSQTILQTSSGILSSPRSLDIDEINNVICVASTGYNQVGFLDATNLSNFSFVGSSSTINPYKVYFNTNDGLFYVTHTGCCGGIDKPIRVFGGSAWNTMSEINSFGLINNVYLDIVQVGTNFYAINGTTNSIDVFDLSYNLLGNFGTPYTLRSIAVDATILYIATNNSVYVKFDTSVSGFTYHPYTTFCNGNVEKIKFDSLNNKLYITDTNCNHIYEIDATTNTLLKTYNNLNSSNISQVWGIDIDTSGNVWFSSYDKLFNLGCTTDFVTGQTTSNEYLSANTIFFNTQLSACCEITNVTSITDTSFLNITEYPSMLHYTDCETCTGSTKDVFYLNFCGLNGDGILMAPQNTYTIGQFVRTQFGNSDWLCAEIVDYYDGTSSTFSFVASGPGFSTCEECTSGATLGLTLINCDTQNAQQVSVTINDWLQIVGFPFGIPLSVVSDINGVCYQVVNSCPIDNIAPLFEIQNYYFNQFFCRVGNRNIPLTPISAGTEYLACQICCPCESGGTINEVVVPHPQWTNGQGRTIVLLDAVQLGGMNGLNN